MSAHTSHLIKGVLANGENVRCLFRTDTAKISDVKTSRYSVY